MNSEKKSFEALDDVTAKRAPASFRKYGFGVLFLFSISSFIASGSSDPRKTIFIAILVIGFAIAIFAFDKLVRSSNQFWSMLGMILGGVTISAITIFTIVTFYYLITLQPSSLDHIFGTPVSLEVPSGISAKIDGNTARLTWGQYSKKDAYISMEIADITGNRISLDKKKVKAEEGEAVFKNLTPSHVYELRMLAEWNGRYSRPTSIKFTTDAINMVFYKDKGVTGLYSGPISVERKPEPAGDTTAVFVVDEHVGLDGESVPEAKWEWHGRIRNGQLDGVGKFKQIAGCGLDDCKNACSFRLDSGRLTESSCELWFDRPSLPYVDEFNAFKDRVSWRPNIKSSYIGEVSEFDKDRELSGAMKFYIGPFVVWFSGQGKLNVPGREIWSGHWDRGTLNGPASTVAEVFEVNGRPTFGERGCARYGTFKDGEFVSGIMHDCAPGNAYPSEFRSLLFKDGKIISGISLEPRGMRFGLFFNWNGPQDGVEAYTNFRDSNPSFYAEIRIDGSLRFGRTFYDPDSQLCMSKEHYGIPEFLDAERKSLNWKLSCSASQDKGFGSCNLKEIETGVDIKISREKESAAEISIDTFGNKSLNNSVVIDGSEFYAIELGNRIGKMGPFSTVAMCYGKDLVNGRTGRKTSLESFCPLMQLALLRVYSCVH
ncbi:hypothetical protein [Azospirillum sp. TSA6c]|uniref:hypothetical protein n=1 Tax=Azospirillum sp. TSA6c TaxID=709813 RepID=UPI0011B70CB0|nr:hypothetical protein [Azospirillum sp. TSA6c]